MEQFNKTSPNDASQMWSEAFDEGYEAAFSEGSAVKNPYQTEGGVRSLGWDMGLRAGMEYKDEHP